MDRLDRRKARGRAFVYRGGVRITDTVVACDAVAGGDLVFVSHAARLASRRRRDLPALGRGRRQLLATELTLALLGPAGQRLRDHALLSAYGRPFALGGLRLELFPSGFMPGAASLLCEHDGRRIVYTGPLGHGPLATDPGAIAADGTLDPGAVSLRAADALCLDATFAVEALSFPPRADALAALARGVREILAAGSAPVVLAEVGAPALSAASALAAEGITLRGHREVVQAAAAYRDAGLTAPAVERFAGRLASGEALLWPLGARPPARRAGARPFASVLLASGPSAEPHHLSVQYPGGADFQTLLRYVEAVGAREVALVNAPGTDLLRALVARGIEAYLLGPPRQIELFDAHAA
jgi:hypothetical protein